MKVLTLFCIVVALAILPFSGSVQAAVCQTLIGNGFTVTVCLDDPAGTATPTPTATATALPTMIPTTPTPFPTATPDGPGPVAISGIWISPQELAGSPMSGAAWADVLSKASGNCTPDLSNQDDSCNGVILAKALVYARNGQNAYKDGVIAALRIIVNGNTEAGGRTLALGRELAAYVIAADLINLKQADPGLDGSFRNKLVELLNKTLDGKTLISCHEGRPNNWGTMCGASRSAVAVYLGDKNQLDRIALVFQGYLGDRSMYASFDYGDLGWQCDASKPVGVNPTGCTKQGHDIGGSLPEEMRRGGGFSMPNPTTTGYPWEGMQGAVVQAEILQRAGYSAWQWSDKALCRSAAFLHRIGWEAEGDDIWQLPLINARCGSNYQAGSMGSFGKIMGFTFLTHPAAPSADIPLPQAQIIDGGVPGERIVVESSLAALTEEVEYMIANGWVTTSEIQSTTDEDGNILYMQAVRIPCLKSMGFCP